MPRFILGPLASITGLSALLWTVLGFVVVVLATPLGRELVAKGERRRAKRRIWGDWIDFCEDADCAQGPSGNRRAPYLLRRPKVRGSQLSLDIQRIQNTQEERLEDLAEQLERFFRAAGHSIEPRPGRVPDAYRIAIDMPARRSTFRSRRAAPEFDTDPSMADWSQLDV